MKAGLEGVHAKSVVGFKRINLIEKFKGKDYNPYKCKKMVSIKKGY